MSRQGADEYTIGKCAEHGIERRWRIYIAVRPGICHEAGVLVVYRAGSLVEAQLVADRLEQEGVVTHIRNVALQGALGELPMSLCPEVCVVNADQTQDALQLVGEFETAQRAEAGEPRVCDVCDEQSPANFEVCWKCRRPFEPSDCEAGEFESS